MKNKNHILVGTLLLLSAILLVGSSFLQPNSAFKSYGLSDPSKVFALDIAENYSFAGETVTLDEHDLRERMDKELLVNTYWQSNTMLMIKRSNKYFPTIERILKEEGVPDDFKYLAVIESGLENVNSPAGAKGFWQIMKTTGHQISDAEVIDLEIINRPGIVRLQTQAGYLKSYLLTQIDSSGFTVTSGSDSQLLYAQAFRDIWSRSFIYLWRPPIEVERL